VVESLEILIDGEEIAERVGRVAADLAPLIDDETVAVCLLTGAAWFAADLMRALSRLGRHPIFDALWLGSYGDARQSTGSVSVRAGLQREVNGRKVLLIDDVFDSGLSLIAASDLVTAAGASEVLSVVFARKPWPTPRAFEPTFVAWEAPAKFLVGYGMDEAGRFRGLPGISSLA